MLISSLKCIFCCAYQPSNDAKKDDYFLETVCCLFIDVLRISSIFIEKLFRVSWVFKVNCNFELSSFKKILATSNINSFRHSSVLNT